MVARSSFCLSTDNVDAPVLAISAKVFLTSCSAFLSLSSDGSPLTTIDSGGKKLIEKPSVFSSDKIRRKKV